MIEYRSYIKSEKWKRLRNAILRKRGLRCERCRRYRQKRFLHIHHKTYERLGNELLNDLEILCVDCHSFEHGKINPNHSKLSKRQVKIKEEMRSSRKRQHWFGRYGK